MANNRLYAKFTLDFADAPKIETLSDSAFRALVEMILYSRRMLTDGLIRVDVANKRWPSKVLSELLSNDLAKPSLELVEVDSGNTSSKFYSIHDFLEIQDSKSKVEERVARNKASGALGGLAKAKKSAKQNASKVLSETLSKTSSESLPETETETLTNSKELVIAKNSNRKKPAVRLSETWQPNEKHFLKAKENKLSLSLEVEKFRNHAIANDRKQADWNAAFNNWLLQASKYASNQNMSRGDENFAVVQRFASLENKKALGVAV